jgi:hypothetical protein
VTLLTPVSAAGATSSTAHQSQDFIGSRGILAVTIFVPLSSWVPLDYQILGEDLSLHPKGVIVVIEKSCLQRCFREFVINVSREVFLPVLLFILLSV